MINTEIKKKCIENTKGWNAIKKVEDKIKLIGMNKKKCLMEGKETKNKRKREKKNKKKTSNERETTATRISNVINWSNHKVH